MERVSDSKIFGRLGLRDDTPVTASGFEDVISLIEAWPESLKFQDRAGAIPPAVHTRSLETKPVTLAKKIFTHHSVDGCPEEVLEASDAVRVNVDWILASELLGACKSEHISSFSSPKTGHDNMAWHEKIEGSPLRGSGAIIDSGSPATTSYTLTFEMCPMPKSWSVYLTRPSAI